MRGLFDEASDGGVRTLLELGSGGGNNASHLKAHYTLTLVDLSACCARAALSTPSASEADLAAAVQTAAAHCRPGGVAIFAPDWVRETFAAGTDDGGGDAGGRALR